MLEDAQTGSEAAPRHDYSAFSDDCVLSATRDKGRSRDGTRSGTKFSAFTHEESLPMRPLSPPFPSVSDTQQIVRAMGDQRARDLDHAKEVMMNVACFFEFLGGKSGPFLCVRCVASWICEDSPPTGVESVHCFTTCSFAKHPLPSAYNSMLEMDKGFCFKCYLPQERTDKHNLFEHANFSKGGRDATSPCRGRDGLLKGFLSGICSNRQISLPVFREELHASGRAFQFGPFESAANPDELFFVARQWFNEKNANSGLKNAYHFVSRYVDMYLRAYVHT